MKHVIGVDPGTHKCGIAVLAMNGDIASRGVVERQDLLSTLREHAEAYAPAVLVVGDRTGSKDFLTELETSGVSEEFAELHIVDEHLTSLEARGRYFQAYPPSGIRRLIPVTMQTPPVPYDDFVAVILAERFLAKHSSP